MKASLILEKSRNPIFGFFHSFEREVRKRPPASKKKKVDDSLSLYIYCVIIYLK